MTYAAAARQIHDGLKNELGMGAQALFIPLHQAPIVMAALRVYSTEIDKETGDKIEKARDVINGLPNGDVNEAETALTEVCDRLEDSWRLLQDIKQIIDDAAKGKEIYYPAALGQVSKLLESV